MALSDWFRHYGRTRVDGAYSCEEIDMTGGDVVLTNGVTRGVEVDADGNVELVFADQPNTSMTRPFKGGVERPFAVIEIKAAGTDADTVYVYR